MPVFKVTYTNGLIEYVKAVNLRTAKVKAVSLHPELTISSIEG